MCFKALRFKREHLTKAIDSLECVENKIQVLAIITIVIVANISFLVFTSQRSKAVSVIIVDDDRNADYKKIQDAINNASEGDTIYVRSGTYNENIAINKSINLIGEKRKNDN